MMNEENQEQNRRYQQPWDSEAQQRFQQQSEGEHHFSASSGPGYGGAAQNEANNAHAQQPPLERVKAQRRPKPASRPFSLPIIIISAIVMLALAAGIGYAAGRQAVEQAVSATTADLDSIVQKYFEEAGGTVLYRSVKTEPNETATALDVERVTELAADSVVEIVTQVVQDYGWFGQALSEGAGSGVIMSEDGYILTSNHVVNGATAITISLRNGDEYAATVVGTDEESDVAVLKIEARNLTPAVLGDSSLLKVGTPAVVIGNPLGRLGGTVTAGVISALDREIVINNEAYTLLQTDAAINGGNSGGGLFNAEGELVGLVMAKSGGINVEGLGFAIPINSISDIISDLINYGYVTSRVSLGVTLVNILDERTAMNYGVSEQGVYILKIHEHSNAGYAGLFSGDRIISIDGVAIESADQVVAIIQNHSAGDVLELEISRGGEKRTMPVTLYGVVPDEDGETTVTSAVDKAQNSVIM